MRMAKVGGGGGGNNEMTGFAWPRSVAAGERAVGRSTWLGGVQYVKSGKHQHPLLQLHSSLTHNHKLWNILQKSDNSTTRIAWHCPCSAAVFLLTVSAGWWHYAEVFGVGGSVFFEPLCFFLHTLLDLEYGCWFSLVLQKPTKRHVTSLTEAQWEHVHCISQTKHARDIKAFWKKRVNVSMKMQAAWDKDAQSRVKIPAQTGPTKHLQQSLQQQQQPTSLPWQHCKMLSRGHCHRQSSVQLRVTFVQYDM